ncbi:MAG: hypothetical protein ACOYOK_04740 [Pseudobdellovibrionaceae bacterium]
MGTAEDILNSLQDISLDQADGLKSAVFDLATEKIDLGKPESLRFKVLQAVLKEDYDNALTELQTFIDGEHEYPNFKERAYRYVKHCKDLVFAIRAKRSFPGLSSLTRAKQQELRIKFKEHFKELQVALKKIEKVEGDLRVQDVRSTIYVVKALWMAAFSIVALAFFLEIVRGLAQTGLILFDDNINKLTNWLAEFIGF